MPLPEVGAHCRVIYGQGDGSRKGKTPGPLINPPQVFHYNPLINATPAAGECWSPAPAREISVILATCFPPLLPSSDSDSCTGDGGWTVHGQDPMLSCPWVCDWGRPAGNSPGGQGNKGWADSPSLPANTECVDKRDIKTEGGRKGHFEKPLESLLSHLFSLGEGSVFCFKEFVNSLPTSKMCKAHAETSRFDPPSAGSCLHARTWSGHWPIGPQRCIQAEVFHHVLLHVGKGLCSEALEPLPLSF